MANINDITTELINGAGAKIYAGNGIIDVFMLFENLVAAKYNVSLKFNSQAIPDGETTVNFTDKVGQAAYPDADYIIFPYAHDVDGVLTPVKIPPGDKTATGFKVDNESGVALTFIYLTIHL